MEIIKGEFGKKLDEDEVPTVKETFKNLMETSDIDTFEKGFGFAFRDDGLTMFCANIDTFELYMMLDQIKDYLRGAVEE